MKKQPLITRRLDMLRDAAGVLRELRGELGAHSTLAAQAQSQVETMIVLYQEHLEAQSALAVLRTSERKPMHRVTRRRPPSDDPLGMMRTLRAIASPPIPAVKGARRICSYCPKPAAGSLEPTCGSIDCVNRHNTLVSPMIIECSRCGCPLGSNRDCPVCYPAKQGG